MKLANLVRCTTSAAPGPSGSLDYVLAIVLIAVPFLAGFSSETAPTAFFIALGVAHLLITIGTKFRSAAP